VTVTRRTLFKVGGAAALALAVGPGVLRAQDGPGAEKTAGDFGPLDLQSFIGEMDSLAREMVTGGRINEEAYLQYVGSLLCRLESQPFGADRPRGMMTVPHRTPYFMVMQINMQPGSALPYHDHHDYNGVILGLEGSVHVRNYEVIGDVQRPPEGETFQIRQTVDTTVEPGRISSVARKRDNIHDLRAGPKGARLCDVFTLFAGSRQSKSLNVDREPVSDKVYNARWWD
jgi:predicted metal-dependent enzyme (double-stranded beta helix superfamily)